jgi:hypothetical protein
MMEEISTYGPIACGMNTAAMSGYTEGVMNVTSSEEYSINHYVFVYGWG